MRGSIRGVRIWNTLPCFRKLWACNISTKLFVGGLSYDTNETIIRDAFMQHGDIIEVRVICDHKSGKSKGYGFVHFTSETAAIKALNEMDGQLLDGRNIRVQFTQNSKTIAPSTSGAGGPYLPEGSNLKITSTSNQGNDLSRVF